MPIIPSLILTNQLPINTYTASVVISGSVIADGLGQQITYLDLTASYISASGIIGGLTKTQYVTSGSSWCTMSFINGSLISVR